MQRFAAQTVRWGAALIGLVIILFFLALAWFEGSEPDNGPVLFGLYIFAAEAFLVLAGVVSVAAVVLWAARWRGGDAAGTQYANERVIGGACLLILATIGLIFSGPF
jgi:hypothetical protein